MKKLLILSCLLVLGKRGMAQADKDSTALAKRLDIFMEYNSKMDFEKIMDCIYPKLFTLAPKADIQASMEEAFTNENLSVKMDSLKVVKVYPLFNEGKNKYARVTYSMLMLMTPKINEGDSINISSFLEMMQRRYGNENERLDKTGKTVIIFQKVDMASILDNLSPEWTFLNINKEDPAMEMLLSKELLTRFYKN